MQEMLLDWNLFSWFSFALSRIGFCSVSCEAYTALIFLHITKKLFILSTCIMRNVKYHIGLTFHLHFCAYECGAFMLCQAKDSSTICG